MVIGSDTGPIQRHLTPAPVSRAKHYKHKAAATKSLRAASRKKDSYYKAQFHRLRAKRGPKKAICAVAASMLTAIFHMLRDGTEHKDLGLNHFDRRSNEVKAKRLVAQLAKLRFQTALQPLAEVA